MDFELDPVHDVAEEWVIMERDNRPECGDWEYHHLPLLEADAIRILVLDPSEDFEVDLKGQFEHISLSGINDENDYVAISYVCGELEEYQDEIYIGAGNGGEYPTISIGPNLTSALRHLRKKDQPVRLWVDAICINHADLTERDNQVNRMRAIFSSAHETVIFLGDEGGNTGRSAWNLLERNSEWAMNERGERDYNLPALREELIEFRGNLEDVEIDVLGRPWFQRVWTFQEVVVSKSVSIQCGHRRIAWDDFCKTLLLNPRYHDRYGRSLRWDNRIETVRDIFHTRCIYQETHGHGNPRPSWYPLVDNYKESSINVLHTLRMARPLQAQDPRDKIYALMGISTGIDLRNPLIAIDYSKPYEDVHMDFARYIMESSNSYDLLSCLYEDAFTFHEKPPRTLPSWVPDWGGPHSSHVPLTILGTLEPETDEQKAQRRLLVKNSRIWLDLKTLVVTEGYVIGEVADYGPSVLLQGQNEREFQDVRDTCEDDPATLYREIINLWIRGFCQISGLEAATGLIPKGGKRSDELHRFLQGNASDLSRLVDLSPGVPRDSVEYHMFARARKTVTWKDDQNKAVDWIIDKSSILDWKRIGLCTSWAKPLGIAATNSREERLMILPPQAKFGDLVVYFRGAQVPFIVRRTKFSEPSSREIEQMEMKQKLEGLGVDCSSSDLIQCTIIGESLVNGFGELARDEVAMTSNDKWSPLKKAFEQEPKTMFVLS